VEIPRSGSGRKLPLRVQELYALLYLGTYSQRSGKRDLSELGSNENMRRRRRTVASLAKDDLERVGAVVCGGRTGTNPWEGGEISLQDRVPINSTWMIPRTWMNLAIGHKCRCIYLDSIYRDLINKISIATT
jgi:hypothetical protein